MVASRGAPGASAAGRGVVLVVIGLALGILLLRQIDGNSGTVEASPEQPSATTVADDGSDTTEPATTEPGETPATTAPGDGSETTDPAAPTTSTVLDARDPSEVRVLVANGQTGVNGAAGGLTDQINALGYQTAPATNTDELVVEVSLIQYEAGYSLEASILAESLGWPLDIVQVLPDPAAVSDLAGANLLVLLGTDRAGQ